MDVVSAWELVQAAERQVEALTVDELDHELERGHALVVDLREQNERERHGVIPGAVHAPRGMLEFWADPSSGVHRPEFRPDRRTILHCRVGGRSALAAETLQRMGYEDVAHLQGGFEAWRDAGKPVVPVEHSPEAPAV